MRDQRRTRQSWVWGVAFFSVLFIAGCRIPSQAPPFTYLTWRLADTSHTMTVNFHTGIKTHQVTIHYDTQSRPGELAEYAFRATGDSRTLDPAINRRVHAVDLRDLSPNTTYYFRVSDGENALTEEKKFKTLPDDGSPLTFVMGGDTDVTKETVALNAQAAQQSPQFALLGGDIAYDNGALTSMGKWDDWLKAWTEKMVTPEGNLIPLVVAIGNHEVKGGFSGTLENAPFFAKYFAQEPGKTYFSRSFGADMVLYVLDSGHVVQHDGAQGAWLRDEMQRTANVKNRFALYHVPLYPSVRDYDKTLHSVLGRKHWLPLFDQFALTAAFENHDHALKRTHPLRNGAIDPAGTLYLGDGCWGKETRAPDPRRWYLAHAEPTRHFWVVKTQAGAVEFKAIDSAGAVRDSYTISR